MNSKIQEILHNQTRKNMGDVDVKLAYINKLPVIQSSHPSIFVDDITYFYTFDGRGLFLSRAQTSPYISLPYETTSLFVVRQPDGPLVAVTLNSKQKLECIALDDFDKGQKQVITRNVHQAVKSGDSIFYVFRKDGTHFIDVVKYHGGRWIGKHACSPLKGCRVDLFPADGSIIYTVDGRTYGLAEDVPEVEADFALRAGKWLVVARACPGASVSGVPLAEAGDGELVETEEPSGYEVVCYSLDGARKNSYFINTRYSCLARGAGNFIVVLNEDKFYILQAVEEGVRLVDIKSQKYIIYDFALMWEGGLLTIHALSDNTAPYQEGLCAPLQARPGTVGAEDGGASMVHEGACSGDHDEVAGGLRGLSMDGDFETGHPVQFEALDCGLDALRSGAEAIAGQPLPRNHLFDAVRESIGRGKMTPSPLSPGQRKKSAGPEQAAPGEGEDSVQIADRFEKYANEIMLGVNGEAPAAAEEKVSPTADYDTLVRSAEALASAGKLQRADQGPGAPSRPSPARQQRGRAEGSGAEGRAGPTPHLRDDVRTEIYSTVHSALETMLVKNESFIKDLIARAIVPGIEAAINEMRIQVITEFRKMDFASNLDPLYSKTSSFKKLVNSGKIGTALQELVKLKGAEFESLLGIIQHDTIEDVDSNVLVLFIAKLGGVLKRHLRDHHARLLHEALEDIDISELSVDSLQTLSVCLRGIKESAVLDSPGYASLNYLMDFIYKKIRRRVSGAGYG